MKKLSLLSAIFGLGLCGAASAADVTIFYSPTCPHCHHAREFISEHLVYEYPDLNVTAVDVMNEDAFPMFQAALQKCNYDNGGVPVLVIGEKCFQGYADFMQQELRDAIEIDMTDDAKKTAADNKQAMESDADAFRGAHAERAGAVTEYIADAASDAQKKTDGAKKSPIYFYVVLIALVAALGLVLVKRKK